MGYAKLAFTTSTTSSQLLSDIFKVVTGQFTSTSQLQYCTVATSEIVNSLGENWTSVVDAANEKAISSPCVVNTKIKYVILKSVTGSTSNATAASGTLVTGTGATASGIVMSCASFVASGASVVATNQTYFNTNTTAALLNAARIGVNTNSDTVVYLSWSARHFLIYGGMQGNAGTMINACLEFPENNLTTYNASAPFIAVKSSMLTTGLTTNATAASDTSTFSSLTTVNQFKPSLTTPTTSGTYALTSTNGTGTLYYPLSASANGMVSSINSSNASASYFMPLWFAEAASGIPIMNCTTLTNVYVTTSAIGVTGDTATVGPYTYSALMLSSTMYGATKYSAVMVPKI